MNTLKIDTKWGGHFTREEAEETLRKYKEKEMIVGSSILVDGYDCLLMDCSHGVFTWALGGSCSKSYAHTVTTRCHGYRSTLRVAIKELKMKAQKKDVVQFEMGTGPEGVTRYQCSPQGVTLGTYLNWTQPDKFKPNTQYAVRMVAVPEGYRVATYEEAEACTAAMSFTWDGWAPSHRSGGIRMNEGQFVVPKETEEDRKKRKIMDRIEAAEKELAVAKEELNKGE